MNKLFRLSIVVFVVGLISACSNTFKADVTRFHQLPPPQGQTVTIVPADPKKGASLEFASYANLVGHYLEQKGYRPAGEGEADLIAELDYSVDDGKVHVRSYPSSRFAFGYGFYHPFYYHNPYWYDPWFHRSAFWGFHDPYDRDVRSYVKYTRRLTMQMRPAETGARNIFEGTVESVGRSNHLPELMPHMVQALFENFPGQSGTTERIVIDLDR